tara:strand:+ start:1229 stop:3115 length:1887 start_codon:yes stop_codon:yes gene_type:complete
MATFTSGYQIKLISDGDESGTWGSSTNQNLQRIEQALGSAVQVNVQSAADMGVGDGGQIATSPDWTATWITDNAGDAGTLTGNGRARYVEFVSTASLTAPVTVQIRGDTSAILPDRVYLVKNSINISSTASNLILNVGTTGEDYTVRPGCFALVVVNASTTGIGSGSKTAQSVFNALSDLQIENLIFGNAGAEIIARDSSANALTIKSTDANSDFLRLDTASNHLHIAGGSAVNTVFSNATTISLANQATDIAVRPSTTNALAVQSSGSSLINLNTVADTLTLSTNNITLDDPGGTNLIVENSQVTALDVYQSGGANFIRLDTVSGTNSGANVLHLLPNQCDLLVDLGNKLQVGVGAAIESYGSALFTTADINGGTIDNASIGTDVVSTVRGSEFSVPSANYHPVTGGFLWEENGANGAGFTKDTVALPVKLRQTGTGQRGFINSSEMVSAANGTTGYFTDTVTFPALGDLPSSRSTQVHSFQIAHGFSRPPKTVNWYFEKINQVLLVPPAATPGIGYPATAPWPSTYTTGDRVPIEGIFQLGLSPPDYTNSKPGTSSSWKDPAYVGIAFFMGFFDISVNEWDQFIIIHAKNNIPRSTAPVPPLGWDFYEPINWGFYRDWQLVVEAWE